MKDVTLEIDGKKVTAKEGTTLLQAARQVGVDIPTLCHNDRLEPYGACRLCLVEVTQGKRTRLVASCCYEVADGLVVKTNTARVEKIRRMIVQLLMPLADTGPLNALAARYGLKSSPFQAKQVHCTLCGLCVRYCSEIKGDHAVYFTGRGINRQVALLPEYASMWCEHCRECWQFCPGGWITFQVESTDK